MSWEDSINKGALALAEANYERAVGAFQSALETAKCTFATDDRRLSQTLSFLGQTYFRLGSYDQAIDCLQNATQKSTEDEPLRVAADHLSLAQMEQSLGLTVEAKNHLNKAVNALKKTNVDSDEAIAGLAKLFRSAEQRENNKSAVGFKQLLAQAQKDYSSKNAQVYFGIESNAAINTWQNLMETGSKMAFATESDQLISAYKNLNSALRIASSTFSSNHPNLAENITNLAVVSARLGLDDDAERLFQVASKICSNSEAESSRVALLKLHMAMFYTNLQAHEQAIQALGEAAQILQRQKTSADKMLELSSSFLDLMQKSNIHRSSREMLRQAIELEEAEKLEQAKYYYELSLDLMERLFGRAHLEVAQISRMKSNVLRKLGAVDEATAAETKAELIEQDILERALESDRLKAKLPAIKMSNP